MERSTKFEYTKREWAEMLPEPYRSQAIEYLQKYGRGDEKKVCVDIGHAVDGLFIWNGTPQGYGYWSKLRNELRGKFPSDIGMSDDEIRIATSAKLRGTAQSY